VPVSSSTLWERRQLLKILWGKPRPMEKPENQVPVVVLQQHVPIGFERFHPTFLVEVIYYLANRTSKREDLYRGIAVKKL
jgi:hypothetical protein